MVTMNTAINMTPANDSKLAKTLLIPFVGRQSPDPKVVKVTTLK